jgi:hypothetical protein
MTPNNSIRNTPANVDIDKKCIPRRNEIIGVDHGKSSLYIESFEQNKPSNMIKNNIIVSTPSDITEATHSSDEVVDAHHEESIPENKVEVEADDCDTAREECVTNNESITDNEVCLVYVVVFICSVAKWF